SKIQAKLSKKNLSDPIMRKRISNQLRALRPLVIGMGNLVLPLQQRRRSEFIKFLSSPQKVARVFNDPTFLFLLDQPSLSSETIAALPTIKTLVLVKRYTPTGLEHTVWPNLTSLEKLIMLDGEMTDALRTAIQNLAKGPKKLQYLNIPHWGTNVANSAFNGASSLRTVAGFDDVTMLGSSSFRSCTSLQSVNFPRLESVVTHTFYSCSALKHVNLPNLKNLGEGLFFGCSQLISVEIHNANVKNIPSCTFDNDVNLTTIVLRNEMVESIDSYGFDDAAVTHVSFSNLKTLGLGAFQGCISLQSVDFPQLESVATYAFLNCPKLRSITLSDQIAYVGSSVFRGVTNCAVNFVGHLTTAGAAENGVTLSCANMKSREFGSVAAFSFTPGADVLEAVSGAALLAYINGVLGLTRAGVPLLTNVPSCQSVLDLGSAVATTAGLVHVDGSLIDIIKIANVERTWNGSAWT
ncbi:MAG: leucine-rich repeat domain-containing protein, partial [Holosporales bacterium]|nr:leucine-rich repeat domain-containing protein [Holosporales bacterium]